MRWGELAIVVTVLAVLAALVYGTHVRDGGFIMDDWSNAAKTRFLAACCGTGATGQGSGYLAQVQNLLADGPAAYHIGLPVLIPFSFFAFRPAIAPHLALAVALGVLVSTCMYAVLRSFRVAPVHAALMAALVLVFPWSDSNRLWAMASYNQLAVVFWLVGLLVALRGLRRSGRRAVLLHAVALVLYAAGIAVYELVAGAVLVTAAFYLHRDAGGNVAWKGMALRWAADVAVTGVTLLAVVAVALPRFPIPWDERITFAGVVVDEALTLLGFAAVPFAQPSRWLLVAALVAVLLAGAVVRDRLPAQDPDRGRLGHWLAVAAAGVLVLGAGYALALLGGYGRPLSAGIENRVNLVSGAGYVMIIYASAAVAGHLAVRAARRPPAWATAVPVAAALVIGAGYVGLARESAAYYDRSFAEQMRVLRAVRDGGPYPAAALIFPFDYPSFTAVGVPVFAWIWDLPPASKIILDDPSPAAFPVLPGTTFSCADHSVLPSNPHGLGEHQRGRYGNTFFVDVPTGRTVRLDDYAECEAAVAAFQPGPLMEGRDCDLAGPGVATRLGWACEDGPPPLMRP
ncbi:MAG: hypothetical protein M3N25_03180 [Actinomycetota bacterium]|nr:hypothetical protein [Actinomycetota bacterium]